MQGGAIPRAIFVLFPPRGHGCMFLRRGRRHVKRRARPCKPSYTLT
nr:MAG TPA_asm: hypothetical protein [Caudoviricetes sp.]